MSEYAVIQHCPTPRELDDLELLGSGALTPLTGFNEPDSPVTLTLPDDVLAAATDSGQVELVDPEGLPLARVTITDGDQGWPVEVLSHPQFGPFRRLYLTPAQVREQYAGRTFVPVTDALTDEQLREIHGFGPTVLLALVGHGTPDLSATALLRATLLVADVVDAAVVAVPLASHGDPEVDHDLGVQVVSTYAGDDPVEGLSEGGELPLELAEIVERDQPDPADQGLVLFFTGLSGSGKSTLAQALMDRVLERGRADRSPASTATSSAATCRPASPSPRPTARPTSAASAGSPPRSPATAAWPCAARSRPFDETRQQVREMVEDAGGAFFLVHVATPLEECERRDRKGLYAKARAGEIPEFTGISSPYEEPEDADVRVDTTGRTIDDALDDVLDALRDTGYLDLTDTPAPVVEVRASASHEARPLVEPAEPLGEAVSRPGAPSNNTTPLRVLFVCTANICRSPFMELTARHLAGPDAHVVFTSAGTHGFREHPMDAVMAATLEPRGVTSEGFLSRPLTSAMINDADLVLTAEATHRTFILDDHPSAFRKIFTLGQFAEVVGQLPGAVTGRAVLEVAGHRRGGATARLDVGDPYGRGPEAAETSAKRIDALLRVVVPALTGAGRITG